MWLNFYFLSLEKVFKSSGFPRRFDGRGLSLLLLEKVAANADGRGLNENNKRQKPAYKLIINGLRLPHLTKNFEEQSCSGEAVAKRLMRGGIKTVVYATKNIDNH